MCEANEDIELISTLSKSQWKPTSFENFNGDLTSLKDILSNLSNFSSKIQKARNCRRRAREHGNWANLIEIYRNINEALQTLKILTEVFLILKFSRKLSEKWVIDIDWDHERSPEARRLMKWSKNQGNPAMFENVNPKFPTFQKGFSCVREYLAKFCSI